MAENVTLNGVVYSIPTKGDLNWAPPLDRYLVALASATLQPTGGSFPLTSDINFGTSFGLLAKYFTSITALPATSGSIRLANTDTIDWRNFANSGNDVLAVNSADQLTFNGGVIATGLAALADGKIWIGNVSNLPIAQTLTGDVTVNDTGVTSIGANKITNSQINSAAGIAYTKLNLTGSIVNTDIFSGAAIAYSKLALSNSIVNADINSAAAIAYSKLNLTGSIVNTDITNGTIVLTTKVTGVLPIANGGTNQTSLGNLTDAGTDGIVVTGGTGALITSASLSQHVADTTHNGYLSSTDWNTFNGKQSTLTLGNLTDAGTDGITVTGGTGAVIGTGTSLSQHVADATHNGYLASADWTTFNGKQTAGNYITALTGDVTATGPGSVVATLATVNSSPGTTTLSTVTTNAKGLVTANSSAGTSGTGNVVLTTNAVLTTPNLGTPSTLVLTNATGLPVTGITATAWTTYTPVVTAQVGTITAYTASGRYQQIGKNVFFSIKISITTQGTAIGTMIVTLPVNTQDALTAQVCSGFEGTAVGDTLYGQIFSNTLNSRSYNNTGTILTGATCYFTGVYEAA